MTMKCCKSQMFEEYAADIISWAGPFLALKATAATYTSSLFLLPVTVDFVLLPFFSINNIFEHSLLSTTNLWSSEFHNEKVLDIYMLSTIKGMDRNGPHWIEQNVGPD